MAAAPDLCECCYLEMNEQPSIECNKGHCFCVECFLTYANESVYGGGDVKYNLRCCAGNCDAIFPLSDAKRVMPEQMFNKYMQRLQDDNITLALGCVPGLEQCPHCPYAAILEHKRQPNFPCPQCHRDSCRGCGAEWREHVGLSCDQYKEKLKQRVREENTRTSIRKTYEERLATAMIRSCPKCNIKLVKDGGCNHITCRCGAHMCYICRQLIQPNSHFDSNNATGCNQFQNVEEDQRMAMAEIKREGRNDLLKHGSTRPDIGAPDNV